MSWSQQRWEWWQGEWWQESPDAAGSDRPWVAAGSDRPWVPTLQDQAVAQFEDSRRFRPHGRGRGGSALGFIPTDDSDTGTPPHLVWRLLTLADLSQIGKQFWKDWERTVSEEWQCKLSWRKMRHAIRQERSGGHIPYAIQIRGENVAMAFDLFVADILENWSNVITAEDIAVYPLPLIFFQNAAVPAGYSQLEVKDQMRKLVFKVHDDTIKGPLTDRVAGAHAKVTGTAKRKPMPELPSSPAIDSAIVAGSDRPVGPPPPTPMQRPSQVIFLFAYVSRRRTCFCPAFGIHDIGIHRFTMCWIICARRMDSIIWAHSWIIAAV